MSSRIIIYGLAGVWWGSLFSILHLVMTVTDQTGFKLLLANLGLTASAGGLAGLGVGVMFSLIPPQLRMQALVARLKKACFQTNPKLYSTVVEAQQLAGRYCYFLPTHYGF